MSDSGERRIDLVELSNNVAVLTDKYDTMDKNFTEFKTDWKELQPLLRKVLIDNGGPSIITQFRKNDETLSKNQKKVYTEIARLKTIVKNIKGSRKIRGEWIKWVITSLIAAYAVLAGTGVF